MIMLELITKIDERTGELITGKVSALSTFLYESGYILCGEDLGNRGVKIELARETEDGRAIILPPEKAKECAEWLLQTIGERKRKFTEAKYQLPSELSDILERLIERKGPKQTLKRGDKKKIKQALEVLKNKRSHN